MGLPFSGDPTDCYSFRRFRGEEKAPFARIHGSAETNRRRPATTPPETMTDAAYGYRNFERFRKRFLLMRWNKRI